MIFLPPHPRTGVSLPQRPIAPPAPAPRYNAGCEAAKRLARWMPCTSYAASKKLGKQLLSKLSKAGFKGAQEREKSAVEKKTD